MFNQNPTQTLGVSDVSPSMPHSSCGAARPTLQFDNHSLSETPIFMPSSPEHCKLTPTAPAPQVAVNLSVDATGRNQWTKLL